MAVKNLSIRVDISLKARRNDVLLNTTGVSIGRCVVYHLDEDANLNQYVCIIRLSDGSVL